MKNILVFTGANCQKCDSLKSRLSQVDLDPSLITYLSVMENIAKAKQYGVRSVPTTVIVDEDGKELRSFISDNKVADILDFMNQ